MKNTPATDAASSTDTEKAPKIVFVNHDQRLKRFSLEWPLNVDGRLVNHLFLRRMTQSEVAAFVAKVEEERKINPDGELRFPLFFDDRGEQVSDAIMSALDADDADALNEAALNFLPRRFRSTPTFDSPPGTGENTEHS